MRITRLTGTQLLLPILGLVFLWPAIINRGPFYFSDTFAYIHAASSAVDKPLHVHNEWSRLGDDTAPATLAPATAKPPATDLPDIASPYPADRHGAPITLGRSIYFGLFLYVGILLHSIWLPIVVQALFSGAVIVGVTRHFIDPAERRFVPAVIAAIALAAITPLPYFACFLMPDIVGACASIAALVVAVGWARESVAARVGWISLMVAGVVSHSAIILVMLAAAALCAVMALTRRRAALAAMLVLAATALAGLGSEAAFVALVQHSTNRPPVRIPFLTARLVADGPGTEYINANCPQSGFVLCRFRQRLPQGSDDFLWSETGVFRPASPGAQRLLSAEQSRFAIAVLRYQPVATAAAFTRDTARQLGMAQLPEFNYSATQIGDIHHALPPQMRAIIAQTAAAQDTMPTGLVSALVWPVTVLSVLVLLATFVVGRLAYARWFAGGACVLMLVNAVVFGCLSTPHHRYEARLIWILPITALLILLADRGRRVGVTASN